MLFRSMRKSSSSIKIPLNDFANRNGLLNKFPIKTYQENGKNRNGSESVQHGLRIGLNKAPNKNEILKDVNYNLIHGNEGGFTDFKAVNDFRTFVQEFDEDFKDPQKEVNALSNELTAQSKRIQMINCELNKPKVDFISVRTKFSQELDMIQRNSNEANNRLSFLMNERTHIKDKFCGLKVKNKELKSVNKGLEENARAYFTL